MFDDFLVCYKYAIGLEFNRDAEQGHLIKALHRTLRLFNNHGCIGMFTTFVRLPTTGPVHVKMIESATVRFIGIVAVFTPSF